MNGCLRCGGPVPNNCRLICPRCFDRLPAGLRQQWRQAKTDAAKDACVARVRHFIKSTRPNAPRQDRSEATYPARSVGQEVGNG
jgi:hypothetical protein